MSEKLQVYKCECCPFTAEILNAECDDNCESSCGLSCCGKPMKLMEEKTADYTTEKHVPLLQDGSEGVKIVVGSTAHPMEEKHYIEWIEVINGPYVNRKYLKPGDAPEAEFYVPKQAGLKVRSYCNIHGLWKG
jgi:superoxide reductase